MSQSTSQQISSFAKINHKLYCAKALLDGKIETYCRHYFWDVMNTNNIVECDGMPIVSKIHALTGWKMQSIERAIRGMVKENEVIRAGYKKLTVNPGLANKSGQFKVDVEYNSDKDNCSEFERIHVERLNKESKTRRVSKKENEMKAVLKKLDDMTEILNYLMSKAKKEDIEHIEAQLKKRHLTVVPD